MMANTTMSDINNEVRGQDDSRFKSDTDLDYIRRISVSNVKVSNVKASNEVSDLLERNALIVVTKNSTGTANQYSFRRYWQNLTTNWIENEYLFDSQNGPYDDIFVFNNYTIVVKNKKDINVIYCDSFRGKLVPTNYEIRLYGETVGTYEAVTLRDWKSNGDLSMVVAVRTDGAITIYVHTSNVNY